MSALATDDFNRANETPLAGNWSNGGDATTTKLASNTVAPTSLSLDTVYYYNAVAFPNDQYAQAAITVTGTVGGGSGIGVAVRVATSGPTFYATVIDHAGSNNCEWRKKVSGSHTQLALRTTAFTNGDILYLEAQGTTLIVKLNGSALGASVTDSAIASGKAGLHYSSTETAASLDNWEGGDFTAAGGQPAAKRMGGIPGGTQIAPAGGGRAW